MLLRILTLTTLLFIRPAAAVAQPCLSIDSQLRSASVSGCLQLFTDSTNQFSLDQVRSARFEPLITGQPDFGRDAFTHWLRFSCVNRSARDRQLVVELDNAFFNEASFFVLDGGRVIQRFEGISWQTPPRRRPEPSRYYAFPLHLRDGQAVDVYVKVRSDAGTFVCPVTLYDRDVYRDDYQAITLSILIPCAMLGLITLISLALWLAYQKAILLHYFVYTLGVLGVILNIEGFLVPLANLPFASPEGWIVCSAIAHIGNLLFIESYVFKPRRIPHERTRIYSFRAIRAVLLLLLLGALLAPPNGFLGLFCMNTTFLVSLFIAIWLVHGLRYRLPEARIYAVAILPMLVAGLLITAGEFIPLGDSLYMRLYFALPVEMLILAFGVARQFFLAQKNLQKAILLVQQEIIQTQEAERQRIAADLHDDLGGTLATVRRQLSDIRQRLRDPQAAQAMDELEPLVQKSSHDLRRIAHNLMPPEFERLGLRAALQQFIGSQPGQPTRFSLVVAGPERRLPVDTELNLYRIVSELVQNIHKHAQASQAAVQLLYQADHLTVMVEDDGLGTQAIKTTPNDSGLGLKNSSLRAEYIGARLWRDTSKGGTVVVLDVPYPISPDAANRADPCPAD